jgi:two-component system LytT family response regulator
MPEMGGFEVIHCIGVEKMPAVIFVTAYDTYAVKAFEYNAIDYLLKPYDKSRLNAAIDRLRRRVAPGSRSRRATLKHLLEEWRYDVAGERSSEEKNLYVQRLFVTSQQPWLAVETKDIHSITAAGNYAEVHTSRSKHLITESLAELERRLNPADFLRVHRSAMVNLNQVAKMRTGRYGTLELVLKSGDRIKVSRSKRDMVRARMIKRA